MAAVGVPGVWASHRVATVVIADDGDLTISWQVRAYTDGVRLRLYTVDGLGSRFLLAEETGRRGIETYRYMDDRSRGGLPVQYRLCFVTPDGEETTLGVVTCFEPGLDDSGSTLSLVENVDVAAIVVADEVLTPGTSGKVVDFDLANGGFRPRPLVPPPRPLVGSKAPKRPSRDSAVGSV